MHPPFMVVDHKIDHDSRPHEARLFEERRPIRRNRPDRLDLSAMPGQPHLHAMNEDDPRGHTSAPIMHGLFARLAAIIRRKTRFAPVPDLPP